jgi:hypothetical protein
MWPISAASRVRLISPMLSKLNSISGSILLNGGGKFIKNEKLATLLNLSKHFYNQIHCKFAILEWRRSGVCSLRRIMEISLWESFGVVPTADRKIEFPQIG